MKQTLALMAIVILVFVLISCMPPAIPEQSSPHVPKPQPSITVSSEAPAPRLIRRVSPSTLDSDLALLLNKNKDATNYYYVYDASKSSGYAVTVRGDLAKKTYSPPQKLHRDIYYDQVYLNLKKQTASGSCDQAGILCRPHLKQIFVMGYTLLPPSPVDLVQGITTAKRVGTEVFDGRQLQIIEFLNPEGKRERLSLDDYYGLPFRQVVYSSAHENAGVEEEHTFTDIVVGQVQSADVMIPVDYSLIS